MTSRADPLSLIDWPRVAENEERSWGRLPFHAGVPWNRDYFPLFRRFVCACCRELESILPADSLRALEVIERFAWSRASFDELVLARRLARSASRQVARRVGTDAREYVASVVVRDAAGNDGYELLSRCSGGLKRARLTISRQAEIFESVAAEWSQGRSS